MKVREAILVVLVLFLISFGLNFIWESYHSIFFFTCCNDMAAPEHLKLMSYVSMIDGLMILLSYGLVSLKSGLFWIKDRKVNNYWAFSLIALIIAVWIEYKGVYLLKEWSYNEWMPVIFGLGLSPLIQLIITGWLSIILTRKLIYGK